MIMSHNDKDDNKKYDRKKDDDNKSVNIKI